MSTYVSRRHFLTTSGIAIAATMTPKSACQLPPGVLVQGVRENVANMDADHPTIKSYRKGVAAMQRLPGTDPLSWTFQANMHGVPQGGGQNAGWSWCMHANWWFLPWHRGYVYFFERIVRKMSNDPSFELPYWAWEQAGQNFLPHPFRERQYEGHPNSLFDGTRAYANTGGPLRPSTSSGSFAVDWDQVRRTSRFTTSLAETSFGGLRRPRTNLPDKPSSANSHGAMESRAHDMVHVAVGGGSGNMGDTSKAARDPIFWLHHANVDRLWNRWLDDRNHSNPGEQDWYDQKFPFYDEYGSRVELSVEEILSRASRDYRYDEERRVFFAARPPAQGAAPVEPKVIGVASVLPTLALGTTPFKQPLTLDAGAKPKLADALKSY